MEYHIAKVEVILKIPSYPEYGDTLEKSVRVAERRLNSVLDCSQVKLIESHIEKKEGQNEN